ncbi:alpha/beta fold hydrolase [Streptomyces sp. NPDC001568]|uniref:alpha/beta fold hydrolase n=1 Tax=Streptomyces sp. NPDC001568 TaxID=3364588 RepID=UPI003681C935
MSPVTGRPAGPAREARGARESDEAGASADALSVRRAPQRAACAVLLLHGGRAEGLAPPPRAGLPRLRMRPFAASVLRATRADRVLVADVRYRHRGWNGDRADPVRDARRALSELRRTAGPIPVVLIGHSMGARAALRVADEPDVRGVVGLAPWCPPGEPVDHLRGTPIVLLHDEQDRVTRAEDSWEYLRRARAGGVRAEGIAMPYGSHAMLRDARTWHRTATAAALALLGLGPMPATGR